MNRAMIMGLTIALSLMGNICRADEKFVFSAKDGLKVCDASASIEELYDFAYSKCWSDNIRPKIEGHAELTAEDAAVIDFCLQTQEQMLSVLSAAVFIDMGIAVDTAYLGSDSDIVRMEKCFLAGNAGTRLVIREWASVFAQIPNEYMTAYYRDVINGTGEIGAVSKSSQVQWPHVLPSFISLLADSGPVKDKELAEGARKLKVSGVAMRNRWMSARSAMTMYLEESIAMRETLMRVMQSADSESRRIIRDKLLTREGAFTELVQILEDVVYDLPFAVLSYRVLGELKSCKGKLNDDEGKMKRVMSEYCQAIVGTEMLKGIRTRYAVSGYRNAVKFLKSELSYSEFKDFVQEMKIYSIIQAENEHGRRKNEIREYQW